MPPVFAYVVFYGPIVILIAISSIYLRRKPGILPAIAVLGFLLSAFGEFWGVLNAPELIPSTDSAGNTSYVPLGPTPSKWITQYLALGGLWLGLLAMLFHVAKQPSRGAT